MCSSNPRPWPAFARPARPLFMVPLRPKLARWHGRNTDGVFWGWNATWLEPPFALWDMTDRLGAIRCPLLVMQGADDEYGTPAQVEAIRDGSGGPAEGVILPGCAHVPHHQARDAVLTRMTAAARAWAGNSHYGSKTTDRTAPVGLLPPEGGGWEGGVATPET